MTKKELQAPKSMNYFFLKFVAGEIDLNSTSAKDPKLAGIVKEEIRLVFTQISGKETKGSNLYTLFKNELIEGGYVENISRDDFSICLANAIVEIMGDLDLYIYTFYTFMANEAYSLVYQDSSSLSVLPLPKLEGKEKEMETLFFNSFQINKKAAFIDFSAGFTEREKKKHNLYNASIGVMYDLDGNLKGELVYIGGSKSTYALTENQTEIVKTYMEVAQLKTKLLKQVKYEQKLDDLIQLHNSKSCSCDYLHSCIADYYLKDIFEKQEIFENWRKKDSSI